MTQLGACEKLGCLGNSARAAQLFSILVLSMLLSFALQSYGFAQEIDYARSADPSSLLATGGQGAVNVGSSGAATHTIPITVPPGRAGMAPQLAFSYNSQSQDNKYLGVGWSLKGLPAIERCPATVAQDGFRGAINYGSDDRFCLDGSRLMAVSGGTYGADGMEYRTEIDSGVRIKSIGAVGTGPAYFKVWTKAGEILEFGNTTDSRIEAAGQTTKVRLWALNQKTDSSLNYFKVEYTEDNANGDYRPKKIDYTGKVGGAGTTRSVEFVYETTASRPDPSPIYVGGYVARSMLRLLNVQTKVGGTLVRDYRVEYEVSAATQRSRLIKVQECAEVAPGTNCLPANTFTWQDGGTGFINSAPNWSLQLWNWINRGYGNWLGDFNGDGKIDILSNDTPNPTIARLNISTGNGFVLQTWDAAIYRTNATWNKVGDFNGDGKSDFMSFVENANEVKIHISTGSNFIVQTWQVQFRNDKDGRFLYLGDFNGDGMTDVLCVLTFNSAKLHLSTGSGFTIHHLTTGVNFNNNPDWQFIGDFNGDGKADVGSKQTDSVMNVNLANQAGTGFNYVPWNMNFGNTALSNYLGDFNGDGKTDVVTHSGRVYLSTGEGFDGFTNWTTNFTGSATFLYVGDFNGDGKTDVASVGSATQTNIHYSTGSNFVPVQTASQTVGRTDADGFRMFYLGDFDGDGKTDLMNGYTSGDQYYELTVYANLTQAPFPDLITTIDNGFGSQTLLSYKSIVDESVYSTDAGTTYAAVYPEKEFQQPIYVVSDRTITDGKGASYPHTYTYGGGKIHQLGRGWLGFRWRETLDLSTKSLTKEFLNQAFPFIGTASETETHDASFAGNTQLFAEVWQTYKNPPPQPYTGVYFVQLERTDNLEWDGQGSPRQTAKTMEYDSANNPTRTFHLGDLSVSGDEQDERTDWATNITSDIFIHRPIRSSLHQGSHQSGTLLREKWLYYDGLGYGVIGNAGLLSKEEARLAQSGGPGSGGHVITTHGYDGFGNRNSTTDPRQCTTTTTYETTHHTYPQTVISCAGDLNHQTDFAYEAKFGVIKSRTDPHNPATDNPVPTTAWDYDLLGRLTKITGPLDGSSQYGTVSHEYPNWGNPNSQQIVTRRTEQHGGSAVLTSWEFFDGLRRTYRTEQEGPAGQNILIETVFDARGLPVSKSAPRFSSETPVNTLIAYDILGRVKRVTNGDGTFITKTYNRGTVTSVNERGKPKTESFDAFGRLKQVVEYNGSQAYETDYLYDAAGSLLKVTNAFGHDSSVMTYDLLGRKATMVDKSMGSWSYEYWPAGDLKKQTDARGTALDFTYDGLGRIKTKKEGANSLASWTYDDAAVPFSKGRLTRVIDTAADTKLFYDAIGRVTQTQRTIEPPTVHTMSQTYDALGRITTETFPDNEIACYGYNDAGWVNSVGVVVSSVCTPSAGYVTSIEYNARGQKTDIDYANSVTSSFAYHQTNFRLIGRQTGSGGVSHPSVPLSGWVRSWTVNTPLSPPSGFSNLYAGFICIPDDAGNCVGGDSMLQSTSGFVLGYIKNSSGTGTVSVYQSTCYSSSGTCTGWGLSLTANGSPVGYLSTTAPDSLSAAQPFVQSNGLLLQGLTGTPSAYLWGLQSTTIDHTDHIYQVGGQPPVGYTLQSTLGYIDGASSAGTAALTRYVNGSGHHYYSTAGDPPSGFSSDATVGYIHTSSGSGLVALYRHHNSGNGDYLLSTSATPPGGYVLQATVGYVHTSGGGTGGTLQNLGYQYDPAGNLTSISDPLWTGARSFQYDDLNRLREASGTFGLNQAPVTQDYVYDAIGNMLYKAGVYYCYGYMANCADASRLYAVKSTSDGSTYTYDANGNVLTGAGRTYTWTKDNRLDVVNGPGSAVMAYDYTGIRVKKTGTGGTTLYPFTGYEIQGGTVTKHIRLGNEIVASRQGSARLFYHNDHLGGVNVISNESAAWVQLNEYDPWGKVSRSEGNTDPNHRFTGQELDVESGIHYYGGRYYDQAQGRFISPDPFVQEPDNPQNLNRYAYVLNSPQNYIDPSGYFFCDDDCAGDSFISHYEGSQAVAYQIELRKEASIGLGNQILSSYAQIDAFNSSRSSGLSDFLSGATFGASSGFGGLSGVQAALDIAGFLPGIGTAANLGSAGISFLQGDYLAAGGATLAAVPIVGQIGKAGLAATRGIKLSEKGLALVEKHLARFGYDAPNAAMLDRLRDALSNGRSVFGADANFYLHEAYEATLMGRRVAYEIAHPAALQKYGVTEFHLYAPEVVKRFSTELGTGFQRFWGLLK